MAFWLLPRKLLVQLERLQFGRCFVVSRHNLQRFHSFFISDCSGYCLVIPLPSFEFSFWCICVMYSRPPFLIYRCKVSSKFCSCFVEVSETSLTRHCFNSGGILKKLPPCSFCCLPRMFFSLTLEAGVLQPLMRHLWSCFQRHLVHFLSIGLSLVILNPHTEHFQLLTCFGKLVCSATVKVSKIHVCFRFFCRCFNHELCSRYELIFPPWRSDRRSYEWLT